MEKGKRKLLGQILKEMGYISEGQIQEALERQRETGSPIGQTLVALGVITESQLARALGVQSGMELVELDGLEISPDAVGKIDASTIG